MRMMDGSIKGDLLSLLLMITVEVSGSTITFGSGVLMITVVFSGGSRSPSSIMGMDTQLLLVMESKLSWASV